MFFALFQILRESKKWPVPREGADIRQEAQKLFRQNRSAPPEAVDDFIFEAETRIELAKHYRIPYARLYYAPKGTEGNAESMQENYQPGAYRKSYTLQ